MLPAEDAPHEGTWLQWPHNFTYGSGAEDLQASWVAMAGALAGGERVHVVVYNAQEAGEVLAALNAANVDVGQVDVFVCPTDDFWVRDNGPVFVTDGDGTLAMHLSNWTMPCRRCCQPKQASPGSTCPASYSKAGLSRWTARAP